jgi:hypothetical protein
MSASVADSHLGTLTNLGVSANGIIKNQTFLMLSIAPTFGVIFPQIFSSQVPARIGKDPDQQDLNCSS